MWLTCRLPNERVLTRRMVPEWSQWKSSIVCAARTVDGVCWWWCWIVPERRQCVKTKVEIGEVQ